MDSEVIDVDDEQPSGALTTAPRSGGGQVVRQEFAGQALAVTSGVSEALAAKARAGVEARCIMAKRWPRHMEDARQAIIAECKRPKFATVAMYSVPRGGKQIEGLSIRFAEVAMRAMGNMEATSETVYEDDRVRLVRVTVVDFETNATHGKDLSITKTVERKQLKRGQRPLGERVNSYGERVFIVEGTDDEVAVKEAAAISKAIRTGILRLVPGHVLDEARDLIKKTAADRDAKDPNAARLRMLDAFAAIGVKPSGLEQWLGHGVDSASPHEIEELRLLHAAIKEGETSWADALAERTTAEPKPTSAPAAPQATKAAPATPAAPPTEPPPQAKPEPAPAPVERAPTRAAAVPKAASAGKGTAALKGALTGSKPAAPPAEEPKTRVEPAPDIKPAPAADPAEREPGWMSGDDEPPAVEERACAGCGVPIDVEVGAPAGAKCYACRQA